jgi:demethylspheroidene O-methyltransferase
LARVLYDHQDDTVRTLLTKVHEALPEGGRLVVSEPMAGDTKPERAGDAYFAVYTLAMGTGKTRKPAEVAALMRDAGFAGVTHHKTHRPFVTSVLSGVRST